MLIPYRREHLPLTEGIGLAENYAAKFAVPLAYATNVQSTTCLVVKGSRRSAFPRLRLIDLGLKTYQCDTTRLCAIGVYVDLT